MTEFIPLKLFWSDLNKGIIILGFRKEGSLRCLILAEQCIDSYHFDVLFMRFSYWYRIHKWPWRYFNKDGMRCYETRKKRGL